MRCKYCKSIMVSGVTYGLKIDREGGKRFIQEHFNKCIQCKRKEYVKYKI